MAVRYEFMYDRHCLAAEGDGQVTFKMKPFSVAIIEAGGKQYAITLLPTEIEGEPALCGFFLGPKCLEALNAEYEKWRHTPLAVHYLYTRGLLPDLSEGVSHDGKILFTYITEEWHGFSEVSLSVC